jgi:hypothetical protein
MDENTPLKKARRGVNPVNKLPKHLSDQGSEWKTKAQYRRQNRHWLSKSRFIALSVLDALKAQKVSQKELAERPCPCTLRTRRKGIKNCVQR